MARACRSSLALIFRPVASHTNEQFGVLREFCGVDERESFGPFVAPAHEEAGDLHHLTVATGRGPSLVSGGLEVFVSFARIPGDVRHHREERVGDRVHGATLRRSAYSTLTHTRYGRRRVDRAPRSPRSP